MLCSPLSEALISCLSQWEVEGDIGSIWGDPIREVGSPPLAPDLAHPCSNKLYTNVQLSVDIDIISRGIT